MDLGPAFEFLEGLTWRRAGIVLTAGVGAALLWKVGRRVYRWLQED